MAPDGAGRSPAQAEPLDADHQQRSGRGLMRTRQGRADDLEASVEQAWMELVVGGPVRRFDLHQSHRLAAPAGEASHTLEARPVMMAAGSELPVEILAPNLLPQLDRFWIHEARSGGRAAPRLAAG